METKFEKKPADGDGRNVRLFFSYVKKKMQSRMTTGPLRRKNGEMVVSDEGMG